MVYLNSKTNNKEIVMATKDLLKAAGLVLSVIN
jgi:hypothetical protein